MQHQLVNLRLSNTNYDVTYQFDTNKQSKNLITITQKNIGTINLSISFENNVNGLIYCKIFQRFKPGSKRLLYNQPISNLINTWERYITYFYINNSSIINASIPTTDNEGNIIGSHEINCLRGITFLVDIVYVDNIKQIEMDNLYIKVKQFEDCFKNQGEYTREQEKVG